VEFNSASEEKTAQLAKSTDISRKSLDLLLVFPSHTSKHHSLRATSSSSSTTSFLAGDLNQNKTPQNSSRHRTSAILISGDDFEINGRRWDYRRLKPIDGGVTGFCTGVLFTP
jgi:hypothetical protein